MEVTIVLEGDAETCESVASRLSDALRTVDVSIVGGE